MVKRRAKSTKATAGYSVTREGKVRNPKTGFGGSRGTSFEGDWLRLAEAMGGVDNLAVAMGVSYPTLYRYAVKKAPVPEPVKIVLGMLAAQKNLPNPAVTRSAAN